MTPKFYLFWANLRYKNTILKNENFVINLVYCFHWIDLPVCWISRALLESKSHYTLYINRQNPHQGGHWIWWGETPGTPPQSLRYGRVQNHFHQQRWLPSQQMFSLPEGLKNERKILKLFEKEKEKEIVTTLLITNK